MTVWLASLKKYLKELQPLQVCLVTNPSKCLLVLLPIIFWCNTNDAFWYSEQIDQTKIWPHFPLEFPEEFRNKKYSYVPHTMNVDDDQVFWFFEEPLKTFLNFFFVVELTFNKGKPRGSRHMFSQSHLACFLGGLFCSVVAERKVMGAFFLGLWLMAAMHILLLSPVKFFQPRKAPVSVVSVVYLLSYKFQLKTRSVTN